MPDAENDAPVCPWCKATGSDPCRTTDGQRRVPHKARARMERAARRARVIPPAVDRGASDV